MSDGGKVREPLNWNTLPREVVRPGVERCGFGSDDAACVFNWVDPGNEIRPHSHTFEQLVFILSGTADYHVGDTVYRCIAGSMLRVPPETVHYIQVTGTERVLNLDVFAPVQSDYAHCSPI